MTKYAAIISTLVALGLGGALWYAVADAREIAREAEAARLEAEGFRVAREATRRKLQRTIAETVELRRQLRELEATEVDPEVTEVVRWRTDEIEIPCPPSSVPPVPQEPGGGPPPPSPGSISLAISGTTARVETDGGNLLILGEVEVTRTQPPPPEVIATLPWKVVDFEVQERTLQRRSWLAGPIVGLVDGEWAYGGMLGREFEVWGESFQAQTFGLVGGGEWSVGASLAWRW